jgi:hypothetical protein
MMPPATPSSAPFTFAAGPSADAVGTPVDPRAEAALASLGALAQELQGQPEVLLALLRRLEQLHRDIQDGPFRASLPEDRNRLFALLAEMERSGGWPYIPRLQLRTFLDLLQREEKPDDSLAA